MLFGGDKDAWYLFLGWWCDVSGEEYMGSTSGSALGEGGGEKRDCGGLPK